MVLMKIAAHLVHPLPVFIPAYGHFIHGKEILSLGFKVHDHPVCGVPHDDDEPKIPRGGTVSREECLQTFPDIERKRLSGGIISYDCQLSDSERFIISLAQSAAKQGADVANNLEVIGFIKNKNRIRGARIKDILTGDEFDFRASFVVSTCGPWLQSILGLIEQSPEKRYGFSKAFDLVVKHKFLNDIAIGIRTQIKNYKTSELLGRRSRYLCITPWKNYSLIGTEHLPFEDNPDNLSIPEHEITNFLRKISEAYPQASLGLEDVRFVY